jgi:hypothetical protein
MYEHLLHQVVAANDGVQLQTEEAIGCAGDAERYCNAIVGQNEELFELLQLILLHCSPAHLIERMGVPVIVAVNKSDVATGGRYS